MKSMTGKLYSVVANQRSKRSATPKHKRTLLQPLFSNYYSSQNQDISKSFTPFTRQSPNSPSKPKELSRSAISVKSAKHSRSTNKAPNPTNFSNLRSHDYLGEQCETPLFLKPEQRVSRIPTPFFGEDTPHTSSLLRNEEQTEREKSRSKSEVCQTGLSSTTQRQRFIASRDQPQLSKSMLQVDHELNLKESRAQGKGTGTIRSTFRVTSHSLRQKVNEPRKSRKGIVKQLMSSAHILANTMAKKLLHTKLSKSYKINQKILNTHHDYEPDWLHSARLKQESNKADDLSNYSDVTRKLSAPDCTRNQITVPSKSTQHEEENRSIDPEERKPERSASSSRMPPQSVKQPSGRHLINLQKVLLIEDKLWSILDSLRKSEPVLQLCEEWWQLNNHEGVASLEVGYVQWKRLFRDDKTRRGLRQALILEILSIGVTHFIFMETQLPQGALTQIKNMMFYQHQNFLIIIDFILRRLPPESSTNVWAKALHTVESNKRSRKLKKSENVSALWQNNEIISNFLKSLCRLMTKEYQRSSPKTQEQFPKPIYTTVAGILQSLEKCHVARARELVLRALDASLYLKEEEQFNKQQCEMTEQNELGGLGDHHTIQEIAKQGARSGNLNVSFDDDKLPVVKAPYLPKLKSSQKNTFTLVLDLDETLVHYFEIQKERHFLVRPGAEQFLKDMSELFEIVIFTAAMQDYADCVLDQLDTKDCISYRLYRQHALTDDNGFIKDLSLLGRDLSRVIIVDNVAENFQLQPDNGIFIRSWFDDPKDTALYQLGPLLAEVVKNKMDVRVALKMYREQMLRQMAEGIESPKLSLDDSFHRQEERKV